MTGLRIGRSCKVTSLKGHLFLWQRGGGGGAGAGDEPWRVIEIYILLFYIRTPGSARTFGIQARNARDMDDQPDVWYRVQDMSSHACSCALVCSSILLDGYVCMLVRRLLYGDVVLKQKSNQGRPTLTNLSRQTVNLSIPDDHLSSII